MTKALSGNSPWAVTYEAMLPVRPIRLMILALGLVTSLSASAQTPLSLNEALKMAKDRNGQLAAARANVRASAARVNQARGAFLPTITPSISYTDQFRSIYTGFPKGNSLNSGTSTEVEAAWQVFDNGIRDESFKSAKRGYEAETLDAIQTLRDTLVSVYTQYFDALRAQELVKVSTAQVKRAQDALAQTEAQIKVGEAAEKDRYQPEADAKNAEVDRLSAEARRRQAEANLKATIGYEMRAQLPSLEKFEEPERLSLVSEQTPVNGFIAEGLENRADLNATRKRIEAQNSSVRLTRLNNGLKWSVDLSYTKTFGPDNTSNRFLGVSASYPLFDGNRSVEAIRESEANRDASVLTYEQQSRQIEADIESAYYTHQLNFDRVVAAKAALKAAQNNYEKISRAKELGAQGTDVVAVSTAQVTLATAERNYVEAIYDYYISEVRLRLVTGRAIPGEQDTPNERIE